jgi:hypothetical protein
MSIRNLPADTRSGFDVEPVDSSDTNGVASEIPLQVGGDGTTWGEARDALVSDLRGPEDPQGLVESANATRKDIYDPFTPDWSKYIWNRLLSYHEYVDQWQSSTVLLTFTARTCLPGADRPVPPVTHYEQIRESREARNMALSRAMNDVNQWDSITVVGTHQTGHTHVHTGVWTDVPVDRSRFEPVIQAHLNQCALAEEESHRSRAITVRSDSARLIAELGTNAPGLDTRGDKSHGLLSEADHRQFGATVLNVDGWRPVRL